MAYSYVDGTTLADTGTATPTLTTPSGIASDDWLFALLYSGSNSLGDIAGWTQIGTASGNFRAYYRIADGTEAASYQWSQGVSVPWVGAMAAYRGVTNLDIGTVHKDTTSTVSGSVSSPRSVTEGAHVNQLSIAQTYPVLHVGILHQSSGSPSAQTPTWSTVPAWGFNDRETVTVSSGSSNLALNLMDEAFTGFDDEPGRTVSWAWAGGNATTTVRAIRIMAVSEEPPAPIVVPTESTRYELLSRRVEARELPHMVTSRMFKRG